MKQIYDIMEKIEVDKELFEEMKKHILDQYLNDGQTGYSKGYGAQMLKLKRPALVLKILHS